MTVQTRAAVLHAPNEALAVETLTVLDPRAGEVLIRYGASGVCHSDLHVIDGEWTLPLPQVLGHEGAGTVVGLGAGVLDLSLGDRVILSWHAPCGRCRQCLRGRAWVCTDSRSDDCTLPDRTLRFVRDDGGEVFQYLGIGTLSEYAVVPQAACVVVPPELPFDVACLIGCGVTTGVGAVVNTARVEPGASVCVIGCGGVGLSVVMGAALAGADPIIAVDLEDRALDAAKSVGATHGVRGDGDFAAAVRRIVPGGVDYAFEAIATPATAEAMFDLTAWGGTAVLVGLTREDQRVSVSGLEFPTYGWSLLGSNYGSSVPAVDFPRLARLYLAGKLPVDRLISHRIELDEINDAFEAMRRRERARSVVLFDA